MVQKLEFRGGEWPSQVVGFAAAENPSKNGKIEISSGSPGKGFLPLMFVQASVEAMVKFLLQLCGNWDALGEVKYELNWR